MRGFLIGMMLGTALLVTAVLVPTLLHSNDETLARENAELARRQLHQWNPGVEMLAERADLDALKQADADELLSSEAAQAAVAELSETFSAQVSAARNLDRKSGLDSNIREVDATAAGLSSAIQGFEDFAAKNAETWSTALKNATTASGNAGNVLGVPIVAGMAELARARQTFSKLTHLRTQMRDRQTDAIRAADRLAAAKAGLEQFRTIDPSEALESLASDGETMESDQNEVRGEADRLRNTIAERESQLEGILSQISAARTEMLSLQDSGFQPGNDGSFSSYRSQFEAVSNRMRDLQQQEHMLRWGGFEEGELDWTAILTQDADAAIEFDGPVLGLEELNRRLALLDDKLARYDSGIKALAQQAEMTRNIGASAKRQVNTFDGVVTTQQQSLKQALEDLAALAQAATDAEDEAIQSAESALRHFGKSRSAASAVQSAARKAQSDLDPQRLNERLKAAISDQRPNEMAVTAEAEAQTLIGRIYAERVQGIGGYIDTLATIEQLGGTIDVDGGALNEALNQAREEGSTRLSEVIETYTQLAESAGNTAWIFHAANGSAEILRGMLNPAQADQYRANAQTALESAVEQAGKSPYGRQYVLFLEQLKR